MAENEDKPRPLTMRWFKPLWRRVAATLIPVGMLGFEVLVSGDQFWMLIWVGAIGYAVWALFINFDNELAKEDAKPKN